MTQTRRIARLFGPYRGRLATVLALIFVSAGLGMLSPFLLREVLDRAIPRRDTGLLAVLVGGQIAVAIATGVARSGADLAVQRRRAACHARSAHRRLPAPAADVARFLHAHAHGGGAVTHRQRHRRGAERGHDDGHLDRLERHHGARDGRRHGAARPAPGRVLARADPVLGLGDAAGGRGAQAHHDAPSGPHGRHERARRGVAERQRHPARKDDGAWAGAGRALRGRVRRARRPRGRLADGRALAHDHGADDVRDHALARLPVRRAGDRRRLDGDLDRHARGLHDDPDAALLPHPVAAQRADRPADRRCPVHADLRVPRPRGRGRRAARSGRARRAAGGRRGALRGGRVRLLRRRRADPPGSRPRRAPGHDDGDRGETGSGKTTLAYLVARLYDPTVGRVTIDGVDVRDVSFAALARTVGLVSQETYLFHASVRENLRFAQPEATDEQLEAAARAARIHELIASLPEGYDTVVGERGYRFSGGEKQRIAIARTGLRNPPVLILDEATSALDSETERAVQAALDELSAGRTTIAIAHRLSTVRDADQIVVLDRGRIVERGDHEDLLAEDGRYARLVSGRGETVAA